MKIPGHGRILAYELIGLALVAAIIAAAIFAFGMDGEPKSAADKCRDAWTEQVEADLDSIKRTGRALGNHAPVPECEALPTAERQEIALDMLLDNGEEIREALREYNTRNH